MFTPVAIPEGRTFMELFVLGLISTEVQEDSMLPTVFQGKDYNQYSLAVLFTLRKYLRQVIKENLRGIPGVAEYGVHPHTYDELRAVEHAILRRQFDL